MIQLSFPITGPGMATTATLRVAPAQLAEASAQVTPAQLAAHQAALARHLRPALGSRALLVGAALQGSLRHLAPVTQAWVKALA